MAGPSSSALAVPMPVPEDEVVELRLALVLYGGVSLAVYMHGVTTEIHQLVTASTELEPGATPAGGSTVAAYRALLERLRREPAAGDAGEPRTRVVVDVIAGTSAGGINGVALAKALARDATQDGVRDLWLVDADIDGLLAAPVRRQVPAVMAAVPHVRAVFPGVAGLAGLPVTNGRRPGRLGTIRRLATAGWHLRPLIRELLREGVPTSVLDGARMSRLAYGVLSGMEPRGAGSTDGSLLPSDHLLELFVTTTDFTGWKRFVPIERQTIRDVNHRHVLRFSARGPAADGTTRAGDFDDAPSQTGLLAFAARATASFPGAFAPISLTDFAREATPAGIAWDAGLVSRCFRPYELDDVDPYTRHFVDGGVLDNMPFGHAIRAIRAKPASTQVRRRLVYIEPDPDESPAELPGAGAASRPEPSPVPSLVATAKQSMSAIPLQQSILDELLTLREANETALRIRDVVERNFDAVAGTVAPLDVDRVLNASPEALATWWDEVDSPSTDTGAYLRLKVQSVVEAFAEATCRRCEYPPESNYGFFVREVLRTWASAGGLYDHGAAPSARQVAFLTRFDVGYRRRRVRFLIDGVSALYPRAGTAGYPARGDLDALKASLYGRLALLETALDDASRDEELKNLAVACFSRQRMRALFPPPEATSGWRLADHVAELEAAIRPALSALEDRLGSLLAPTLTTFNAVTMQGFLRRLATVALPEDERRRLVVRFLAFARWDPLTYPLRALSDVGEFDVVQVVRLSPHETRSLTRPPAADGATGDYLKGATIRHFGAFFERSYREHDYLWGRLDAAAQLIDLLTEDVVDPDRRAGLRADACAAAFAAVLDAERGRLTEIGPLFVELDRQVAALQARAPTPAGAAAR